MVYAAGILGFIGGFILGLRILQTVLKDKSNDELRSDRALRWKYGILVWAIAGFTAWSAVKMYQAYFP